MITINEDNPYYLGAKYIDDLQQRLKVSLLVNESQELEITRLNQENAVLHIPDWEKRATAILKTGLDYVGIPYLFGEEYPKGFDCSSFTQRTFGQNGIKLLRTSWQQLTQGEIVEFANIRKGDLLFFKFKTGANAADHVAIASGQGGMLQTNDPTKPIRISPIPANGYVGTRRMV